MHKVRHKILGGVNDKVGLLVMDLADFSEMHDISNLSLLSNENNKAAWEHKVT